MHYLGVIAYQEREYDIAVDLITKALDIEPNHPEAHNNLGNVLQILGKLDEAAASYRKAIDIKPDYAEAHCNFHALLLDPSDMMPSIKCLEKAVENS